MLVVRGDALNFMDPPSDLMISNIHYDVMRRMIAAPGIASGTQQFILSGLLRSQAREIEYQLQRLPVRDPRQVGAGRHLVHILREESPETARGRKPG
jgi:hypothetical protein